MKSVLITILIGAVLIGAYFLWVKEAMVENIETSSSKLDINVVCEKALAYMTFTDGESAAQFIAECKEGKHPAVIEDYKVRMGYGDGTTI